MKVLLSLISFVFTVNCFSASFQELKDSLNLKLGVQIMRQYCPAQSKETVLGYLSQINADQCGITPANFIYNALNSIPLEGVLKSSALSYDFIATRSKNDCQVENPSVSSLINTTNESSLKSCLKLGHSDCELNPVELVYTTDKYCFIISSAKASEASKNINVIKMLQAKVLLKELLEEYRVLPCNISKIKDILNIVIEEINSTTLAVDYNDPLNQFRYCQLM